MGRLWFMGLGQDGDRTGTGRGRQVVQGVARDGESSGNKQ